jgi:pimeloyl-ACP methyl ester carboxylesterase
MTVDATHVLHDGPWRHRFVSANGARFHVAEVGDGPLVLLLHGFPQMWWTWRHQLTALADAGYRAAAMDLRGYGASDKPPRGYDTITLAADVAAVVRSLGAPSARVVGHDWGAWIAWSMPALEPDVTDAIAALGMPHPLRLRSTVARSVAQLTALRNVLAYQRPIIPERRLARDPRQVATLLRSGGDPTWPDAGLQGQQIVQRYAEAMAVPFVAHSAMEYFRWVVRSQVRPDGRRFHEAVRRPIEVPVLHLQGARDAVVLASTSAGSERHVTGPYCYTELDCGHYLPEERADEVSGLLVDWVRATA